MDLELTTRREGKELTVSLKGEVNTITAPKLKELSDAELPETDVLVLDFAECDFVSSAGLRVLVNDYKVLKKKGGQMKLINIGKNFSEVLNITGLDTVFGIAQG